MTDATMTATSASGTVTPATCATIGTPRLTIGIDAVALLVVVVDGAYLARIGDQDLVAKFAEQRVRPGGMGAGFDGDPCRRQAGETLPERGRLGLKP